MDADASKTTSDVTGEKFGITIFFSEESNGCVQWQVSELPLRPMKGFRHAFANPQMRFNIIVEFLPSQSLFFSAFLH
jgi:hypothetical protein